MSLVILLIVNSFGRMTILYNYYNYLYFSFCEACTLVLILHVYVNDVWYRKHACGFVGMIFIVVYMPLPLGRVPLISNRVVSITPAHVLS